MFGSISHCYRTGSCGVVHTGLTASHGLFRMSLVGLFGHVSLMLTGGSVRFLFDMSEHINTRNPSSSTLQLSLLDPTRFLKIATAEKLFHRTSVH